MWNYEMQARLEELASNGLLANEIATKLGITKNAVIGRAYRTGVELLPRSQTTRRALGGSETAYPCGHPRIQENSWNNGGNQLRCAICRREYDRIRKQKKRRNSSDSSEIVA